MLRVSPDGKEVWVQTSDANTNVVLDAETLATITTTAVGRQPVTLAFQPGAGRYAVVTHLQDGNVVVLNRQTGREVKRIDVGKPQANTVFTPDGATAFVMAELAVATRIPTGGQPMGLVLLDPALA
jgi:YVTN family beta-propeller protein